jgi:hypothetical protein
MLSGHRRMEFRWEYRDYSVRSGGQGLIRLAGPDSARLDLLTDGGFLPAPAILIGSGPIWSPVGESMTGMLPAAELVWAAVGRLAVPAARDTVKRVSEGIVHVEIGSGPTWRATFDRNRLASLVRAEGRRVTARVTRAADGSVTYVRGRSTLTITEVRVINAEPFDPEIWRR